MSKDKYDAVRQHLESFIPLMKDRFPGERGLERMKILLSKLGNPHLEYPTIHIAGTSGKGSTATMLANMLSTAGYNTGLTISPHLQVINERMQIDGQYISLSELEQLVSEIDAVVWDITESALGKPTYFEILLAISFMHFAKKNVDIAVVEAGLGGRWDGTNVVKSIVGVITNIGLDHTEVLGKTIMDIAKDKAGIIKHGMIIVSGIKKKEAQTVIQETVREKNGELLLLGKEITFHINDISQYGSLFNLKINETEHKNIFLRLAGSHQVTNATLAISTATQLSRFGFSVHENHIKQALKTTRFPGRLEMVQQYPPVILDGAHNPDKIRALVESFPLFPTERWIVVFAAKQDKPVRQMLALLFPHIKQLIATEFTATVDVGFQLSMTAKEIFTIAASMTSRKLKTRGKTFIVPDSKKAVKAAIESAGHTGQVLVTGSLYLVGEVRGRWYPKESLFTANT